MELEEQPPTHLESSFLQPTDPFSSTHDSGSSQCQSSQEHSIKKEVGFEFYVNLGRDQTSIDRNDTRDSRSSPSPQPSHPPTSHAHEAVPPDPLFTREVLVDGPRKPKETEERTGDEAAAAQASQPPPAHSADTTGTFEHESRLDRVRKSLRRSLSNLKIRWVPESHDHPPPPPVPPPSPPVPGTSLSLQDYLAKFSQFLPTQVTITEGHSDNPNCEFSVGEVVTLHFVKRNKYVEVRSCGESTLVPLNGSVNYALAYDPDKDPDKAKNGYTFQTVGEMLAMRTMPRVVYVSEGYSGGSERASVRAREILLVLKTKRRMFSGAPSIVVYSMATESKKVLRDNCAGKFTTNPILTKLPMPQILKHFDPQSVFPCRAVMFIGGSNPYVNQFWFNKELTITKQLETESVIVTPQVVNDEAESKVYELPTNYPISISHHEGGMSRDELVAATNNIYSRFNQHNVERVGNEGALEISVHSDHQREGIIWKVSGQHEAGRNVDKKSRVGGGDEAKVDPQLTELLATVKDIQQQVTDSRRELEASRAEVALLRKELAKLKNVVEDLQQQKEATTDQEFTRDDHAYYENVDIRFTTVISPESQEPVTKM